MQLPLPRDLIGWTARTATSAASIPTRVVNLLILAESVVARADELVRRTERTIAGADEAVALAREQLTATQPLIRFAEEFSAHEVHAAIKLVDELPRLSKHLSEDILPILGTLNRVGPDIHELLAVANDVRQAILGIPGFEYLRRRGETKDADPD